jgi:hypothetical protein
MKIGHVEPKVLRREGLLLGVPCLSCTHRPSNSLVIFSNSDRKEGSAISGRLLSAIGCTHERGAEVPIYENGKPLCKPQQLHTGKHWFVDFIDGVNMKHISETLSNALNWQMRRNFLVQLQSYDQASPSTSSLQKLIGSRPVSSTKTVKFVTHISDGKRPDFSFGN